MVLYIPQQTPASSGDPPPLVDLRIAVDVVEPVGANAGGCEIHRLAPAQGGKDILADVLIGEGNEFLDKVLLQLVQNDLLIVQFQLPL